MATGRGFFCRILFFFFVFYRILFFVGFNFFSVFWTNLDSWERGRLALFCWSQQSSPACLSLSLTIINLTYPSSIPPSNSLNSPFFMSSRAGGLYGGIQFSSNKAFNSSSGPQETPAAPPVQQTLTDQPQSALSSAAPAQSQNAPSTSTAADTGAAVKATAGIFSSPAALPM